MVEFQEEMKKAKVYKIDCSCGCNQFYIGSTSRTLKERLKNHFSSSRKNNSKFMKHIRKVGKDKFTISLLEEVPWKSKLIMETKYYQLLKPSLNSNLPYDIDKKRNARTAKVYRIDCNCGCEQFYVGSTINTLKHRFNAHMSCKYDSKFYRHVRSVGRNNFKISLVETVSDVNKLLYVEANYCRILKPQLNTVRPRLNKQEEIIYCRGQYKKVFPSTKIKFFFFF